MFGQTRLGQLYLGRKLFEIDKYVTHTLQMMMMMRGTHHDNARRGKGEENRDAANDKKSDLEKLTYMHNF